MTTRSKILIISLIVFVVAILGCCIGYVIHKIPSGPYYIVSGAGSAAANGTYHIMRPQPTKGFWRGKEGRIYINDKKTAYFGINQQCYIWANDHSANPAAAESLYMIYSTDPTSKPWNVNVGESPAPT